MSEMLRIKLTTEQQKQVFEATGKSYTELTFDNPQSGKLSEKALGAVVGGSQIAAGEIAQPGQTTLKKV